MVSDADYYMWLKRNTRRNGLEEYSFLSLIMIYSIEILNVNPTHSKKR